jgi:hypothetical protein
MTKDLSRRAQRLKAELRRAHTFEDTLVALSMVDTATLREIEMELLGFPVDTSVLIERLAEAHMAAVKGNQAANTNNVNAEVIHGWATQTLAEWLNGVSDFDPSIGGQYHIAAITLGGPEGVEVFEVTTPDGKNPRRFAVSVEVTELGNHRWSALQKILGDAA